MNCLQTNPAVFAVNNEYQIFVPVTCEMLFWVEVGSKKYYDHSNGILKSNVTMHKVHVPMKILDAEKKYTVVYRKIIDRKPYFPECEDEIKIDFEFKPLLKTTNINIYHISDTHNMVDLPTKVGKYFGNNLDLLILNGDIPNHSGDIKNFNNIYEIASNITHGNIPIVFSRGNHDTRGFYAENFAEYTPTFYGKTYYTFKLGCVWGIVMDCGEDKNDSNPEYGGTVCYHQFREEETQYLENVIENCKNEYAGDNVKYKLVICHIPFTYNLPDKQFVIEQQIYSKWAKLLKEKVKPDIMLCGHIHEEKYMEINGEYDDLGQPCPIFSCSNIKYADGNEKAYFAGGAITLNTDSALVVFNDSDDKILGKHNIKFNKKAN